MIEVDFKTSCFIIAKSKKEAIEIVKQNFKDENNFDLTDKEIKVV